MRKVENKRDEAKDGEKESGAQADVASILARRVAVEMSDSDDAEGAGGPTDSEYDSDDWGDESTAWQKHLAGAGGADGGTSGTHHPSVANLSQYFFKSQESLATVIDIDEDPEGESQSNKAASESPGDHEDTKKSQEKEANE